MLKKFLFLLFWAQANICYSIKFHEKIGDWELFSTKKNDDNLCYIVNRPINNVGFVGYKKRYLIISELDSDQYEINISVEDIIDNRKIFAVINGKSVDLVGKGNLIWAKNSVSDNLLVEKMKLEDKFQIIWYNEKDERKIEEYSLKNLSEILQRMNNDICN